MKKYPVLPELIVWLNSLNDSAPATPGPLIVLIAVSDPLLKLLSVEYHSFRFVTSSES